LRPQCLRRSAHLVKERWGEGISGNVIVTAWMILVTFQERDLRSPFDTKRRMFY
jgi:hypothetical protein